LELTLPKKYLSLELQQEVAATTATTTTTASAGLQYELAAAVLHLGGRATGGHYTCFGRDVDDKWYYFDDQKVSEATSRDVLNARSEVRGV